MLSYLIKPEIERTGEARLFYRLTHTPFFAGAFGEVVFFRCIRCRLLPFLE